MSFRNARRSAGLALIESKYRVVAASVDAGGWAAAGGTAVMTAIARARARRVTSTHSRTGIGRGVEGDNRRLAAVGAGRENHPVRLDPHQLRRLQVEDDDHRLADERFGFVRLRDAGDERAVLRADVDRQLEQLLRLLHFLGG